MPTTSNFGWTTPADTDLVKDGASAIRTLGNGVDSSFVDLKGGTSGQILSKNSNTDLDFVWIANDQGDITAVTAGTGISGGGTSGAVTITNDMATTITAAGDIVVGTGSGTYDNLPIGTTNQVLTADTSVSPYKVKWASSNTGTIWTERKAPNGDPLRTVAYNGSNLYVAVGSNGALFSSADGITWTSRTSGFGVQNILWVAYGNGLFVAVGNNGTLTTSSDGVTWTARTANMSTNSINHVIYANSVWVAVGAGGGTTNTGGITYSTDGITWTRKSQSLTVGTGYLMTAWNGTNFIVVSGLSTNNYLYASTPSGTWTEALSDVVSSGGLNFVVYDGTRTIYSGQNLWAYTTATTLTSSTQYNSSSVREPASGANSKWQNYYYNGRIYMADIYTSDWNVVPVSTSFPTDFGKTEIAPATSLWNTTPYLNNQVTGYFVGAIGRIIFVIGGRIFTSF